MDLSDDFSHVLMGRSNPILFPPSISFPMNGEAPVVSIDFDGTLAEYTGWKGDLDIGRPLPNAIWALRNFKYNGWETEIFTIRSVLSPVWDWVDKYAPGLIDRVNESRGAKKGNNESGGHKPHCDLFIDDRNEYWFGRKLNWVEIMRRIARLGLLPSGLLPRKGDKKGDSMIDVCDEPTFRGLVRDLGDNLDEASSAEIIKEVQSFTAAISNNKDDRIGRARNVGKLLESVLKLMALDRLDPVGCILLAQQVKESKSVDTLS